MGGSHELGAGMTRRTPQPPEAAWGEGHTGMHFVTTPVWRRWFGQMSIPSVQFWPGPAGLACGVAKSMAHPLGLTAPIGTTRGRLIAELGVEVVQESVDGVSVIDLCDDYCRAGSFTLGCPPATQATLALRVHRPGGQPFG